MPFNPGKTSFTVVSGMGDGLGGALKPSKMTAEAVVNTTGTSTVESNLSEEDGADRFQERNMETVKTGAQFSPKSQKNRSTITEIQEIDVALGTVDSCEKHVASNITDTSQVIANNDATVTPSMPAHSQKSQEQALDATANRTLRTWKRIARDSTMDTEITQGPTATKRHRDEDLEILPELPIKKIQVTHERSLNTELMASVMWTVWHRRNQLRVNSNALTKAQVPQQAKLVLEMFQNSQQSLMNHAADMRTQQRVQWRPPPANCVKLNFDGAIFSELGKAGLGVVVHDSHGNAIASLSEQAPLPFSPVIVEAMAAARAITFA
nr:hypothetical protein CFP56_66954 [Quercus suber]